MLFGACMEKSSMNILLVSTENQMCLKQHEVEK